MSAVIKKAKIEDIPVILDFINELAQYEKLEHEVVANETTLRSTLFGEKRYAEVIFLEENQNKVGFALFFHNYSTFLGQPGIYLEDLYVKPEYRGKGHGKHLLTYLANLAIKRNCGRLEWCVLNWNQSAIDFYQSLEAKPMSEWTIYRVTGKPLTKLAMKVTHNSR